MKSINMDKMFKKLETSHILAGVAFLVLLWALMNYSNTKSTSGFTVDDQAASVPTTKESPDVGATPPPPLTANELLPNGATEEGDNKLGGMNFLQAGDQFNINTVSGSLRNANYQLRADPPIAKTLNNCPWNTSTIEADLERKPLEYCGN